MFGHCSVYLNLNKSDLFFISLDKFVRNEAWKLLDIFPGFRAIEVVVCCNNAFNHQYWGHFHVFVFWPPIRFYVGPVSSMSCYINCTFPKYFDSLHRGHESTCQFGGISPRLFRVVLTFFQRIHNAIDVKLLIRLLMFESLPIFLKAYNIYDMSLLNSYSSKTVLALY